MVFLIKLGKIRKKSRGPKWEAKRVDVRDKGLVEMDYGLFAERLQQSLVVLRDLLDRPGFGDGPKTLGAEMELSIVDQEGCAYPINRSVLAGNLDPSFQLELDRFNLEYNTSPVPLAGTPFSRMESELTQALETLNRLAGARWQRRMLDHLEKRSPRRQAVVALLDRYLEKSDQGCPVGEWTVPN